jgi:predicted RNA methylase
MSHRSPKRSRARTHENVSYEMWELAGVPNVERVVAALREGRCPPDRMFDYFLPQALRRVSTCHWTPLVAAARAAQWIDDLDIRSVVDVGAGAGKFCVIGALASAAEFQGIEQRAALVDVAEGLAQRFGVSERVRFRCGALEPRAIPAAEAYYVYNPFGENLLLREEQIDLDVELSTRRFEREVRRFEALMQMLPRGSYILSYNGFGGRMPTTYVELRVDDSLPSVLRLWQKQREGIARDFHDGVF